MPRISKQTRAMLSIYREPDRHILPFKIEVIILYALVIIAVLLMLGIVWLGPHPYEHSGSPISVVLRGVADSIGNFFGESNRLITEFFNRIL